MSSIEVINPNKLPEEQWHKLYDIAKFACEAAFLDGYDIDAYLGEFDEFMESRVDPSSLVLKGDGRRNANQEFHHPRLAIAYEADEPLGWMYVNRNVSGGGSPEGPHNTSLRARIDRGRKRVIPPYSHYYFKLEESYTLPSRQGQRIATDLTEQSTRVPHAIPTQPAVTWLYPGIYKPGTPSPITKLEALSFGITDDRDKSIPGLGMVRRVRMQAPSVHGVRSNFK